MDFSQIKIKTCLFKILFISSLFITFAASVNLEYSVNKTPSKYIELRPDFKFNDHKRLRRDAEPTTAVASITASASNASVNATAPPLHALPANNTAAINRTSNETEQTSSIAPAVVTKTPLLGENGSSILHSNSTGNTPKVSDPILPDDNTNDVFKETPETIKAEKNIKNLTYDEHDFYKSSFIGDSEHFQEFWKNITQPAPEVHDVLSNSHRRATTLKLSFDFPFYGHGVRSITVATGGFVYTGDHVHNWLAATQYIAPLMANFDTTLTNDSFVKMNDDGEKFTVFWENATLQEDPKKKFNFAVTLFKNGDIVFAYKDIPIPVQAINDSDHPVKIGISDAYLNDKIMFYVRRKTIYEYHRVSFKNYEITNNTLLKLEALPTCLQYDSCRACINHNTGFTCQWCEQIQKCSSGTDRNKQDWLLRNCDKSQISSEAACPASAVDQPAGADTAYTTDTRTAGPAAHDTAVVSAVDTAEAARPQIAKAVAPMSPRENYASPVGAVVAVFVSVLVVCCVASWILYAFKNPHTRSGQLLIKYRPSQWSWRRGEARYTAATIHM